MYSIHRLVLSTPWKKQPFICKFKPTAVVSVSSTQLFHIPPRNTFPFKYHNHNHAALFHLVKLQTEVLKQSLIELDAHAFNSWISVETNYNQLCDQMHTYQTHLLYHQPQERFQDFQSIITAIHYLHKSIISIHPMYEETSLSIVRIRFLEMLKQIKTFEAKHL